MNKFHTASFFLSLSLSLFSVPFFLFLHLLLLLLLLLLLSPSPFTDGRRLVFRRLFYLFAATGSSRGIGMLCGCCGVCQSDRLVARGGSHTNNNSSNNNKNHDNNSNRHRSQSIFDFNTSKRVGRRPLSRFADDSIVNPMTKQRRGSRNGNSSAAIAPASSLRRT